MFYETVLKLCAQKGISLTSLMSEELHMSTGNITRWKSGTVPGSTTLQKIANYFGVTTDYLLGNEQKNKTIPDRDSLVEEAIEIMNSLPADLKVAALDQLKVLAAVSKKKQKK